MTKQTIAGIEVNVSNRKATNFHYRITKKEAERLVKEHKYELPFDIMCKEYGEDEDWVGMNIDDIREDGKFDDNYKTFEIWDNITQFTQSGK
jgi:hypothetical protein